MFFLLQQLQHSVFCRCSYEQSNKSLQKDFFVYTRPEAIQLRFWLGYQNINNQMLSLIHFHITIYICVSCYSCYIKYVYVLLFDPTRKNTYYQYFCLFTRLDKFDFLNASFDYSNRLMCSMLIYNIVWIRLFIQGI